MTTIYDISKITFDTTFVISLISLLLFGYICYFKISKVEFNSDNLHADLNKKKNWKEKRLSKALGLISFAILTIFCIIELKNIIYHKFIDKFIETKTISGKVTQAMTTEIFNNEFLMIKVDTIVFNIPKDKYFNEKIPLTKNDRVIVKFYKDCLTKFDCYNKTLKVEKINAP